jgi:hypothetical protein
MRRSLAFLSAIGLVVAVAAACHEEPPVVTATTTGTQAPGADEDDHAAPDGAATGAADASADGDGYEDTLGRIFGEEVGDAFGVGGLGLSGTGAACDDGGSGGGTIGLGNVGTTGRGAGIGSCAADGGSGGTGFGLGLGLGLGSHPDGGLRRNPHGGPHIREASIVVAGSVPREVVQRIVRQSFGRLRVCYAAALATAPQLAGAVAVHFVIDPTGAVTGAQPGGGSFLPATMVSCVVGVLAQIAFPAPSGNELVDLELEFKPGP